MPASHTSRDTLFELVEAAVGRPPDAGGRPWTLTLDAEEIERFADRGRALAADDPDHRELTVGCGAALYNLRVASEAHGLEARIELGVDRGEGDGVGTVEMRPSTRPGDYRLADAVELRRTRRHGFRDEAVPDEVTGRLVAAVEAEGALAVVADDVLRRSMADLVAKGDRLRFSDRRWRRELASWMHPRRRSDGPEPAEVPAPLARLVVSALDVGARAAHHDHELVMSAPLLVVIATSGDSPADWLRAGEGLEHLLLEAATGGLEGSFLNQPCHVTELRAELRTLLPGKPFPQVVVRIGYPADAARAAPSGAAGAVTAGTDGSG